MLNYLDKFRNMHLHWGSEAGPLSYATEYMNNCSRKVKGNLKFCEIFLQLLENFLFKKPILIKK